ncbi:unnamed protein product [Linum trigynum]|uniref:Uncharacterized protein n=1 Tax=Linum trigynum TaxID=586398 RepID=A0AAV2E7N1_9ROSI
MDPHGFSNHWGYQPPSVWYYPETSWSNQGGEDYGFECQYQPPYYGEQPNPWEPQGQYPFQEEFLPQPEGPSELELAMEAFTGHSAEPCYTSLEDPNKQLRLLVEQFARDNERSCSKMDLQIKALAASDPSFLHDMEETIQRSAQQTQWVEQVCSHLAQDHLSATTLEVVEDDKGYGDVEEHTEVITENTHDSHDQESPLVAYQTFPHLCSNMLGPCEEMQDDPIEEIAWRLDLQSVLEEEERARMRKEVVEDEEERKEEVVLDLFQGERPHFEEVRGVEEAIGVQAEDEVEVEEACTGPMLHLISPPNIEELLGKDPFAVSLCQTKTTSTSIPLGGCEGGQSNIIYLILGSETRADAKERSREWRLHLPQGHEPSSSPITSPACDSRLHIIDENLNFKEVLGWTKT